MWHLDLIKHNLGSYTKLFQEFCDAIKLPCKTIEGYCKAKDYEPGNQITDAERTTYSAVLINQEWRFIDVNWASRKVAGGSPGEWDLIDDNGEGAKPVETSPEVLKYQYDEYYFLTDPHELVYNHLPKNNDQWQLLARPISLNEFQEMVYIKPAFFELGLKVGSHPKCVLEAAEGKVEIQIELPQGEAREFMYRLWLSTKGKDKATHGNFNLERFAFMQVDHNTLEISIRFPVAGRFKFKLFGRNADKNDKTHFHVCTYIIDCLKRTEDCRALPQSVGAQWGPGPKLDKAGLVAVTHKDGIIEPENGIAEIRFKNEKRLDMIHHLKGNDGGIIENQVIHWSEGDELVLKAKVPKKGEYALEMFANKAGHDGPYPSVCKYLVTSNQGALDPDPFPVVANGRLGYTDHGKTIGLHPKSHPVPYITAPEDGKLNIVFTMDQPLDFTSALGKKKKALENCSFITQSDKDIFIGISLPDTGLFVFTIYAKLHGKEGTLPAAFQYLIDAKAPNRLHQPFPKIYDEWGAGCQLAYPKSGKLLEHSTVSFKLKVPNNQKVAAFVDGVWTYFKQTNDEYWVGDVDTKDAGNVLKIGVNVDPESNRYSFMVEYEVVKDEEKRKCAEELKKKNCEAHARMEQEEREKKRLETDYQNVRNRLVKTLKKRNIRSLKQDIQAAHGKKLTSRLKNELSKAKQWLTSLERTRRLGKAIEKMDKALKAEIRNCPKPPPAVHEVMVACFLLLGENEERMRIWKECQKLCFGPNGIFMKLRDLDIRAILPETSAKAYTVLSRVKKDALSETSAGAVTFYDWALGVIEENKAQNTTANKSINN